MDAIFSFIGVDMGTVWGGAVKHWAMFFNPAQRMYVLYLLTSFLLAFGVWKISQRQVKAAAAKTEDTETSALRFLGWLFDPKIYGHPSARQDYVFFLVNGLVFYGVASQYLASIRPAALTMQQIMSSAFGELQAPLISGLPAQVLYTFVFILLFDFGLFITHWLFHKVPWMWPFHTVHHSAAVMTPLTVLRMHPVDIFFTSICVAALQGLGVGLFVYLENGNVPSGIEILGMNVFVFLFYLAGYNLRHSHVWLNYPKWLSRIFVSPAQHQIHHSTNPKHFDRNMGFIFSFWDALFRTQYVPETREDISYGINKKTPNPFRSVTALFLEPFKTSFNVLWSAYKKDKTDGLMKAVTIPGFAVIAFCMIYAMSIMPLDRLYAPPPSVHLEDLTWSEVQKGMKLHSYDTVLIPTGGTEQNGPHVVLGKHNYIVRYTAGKIAHKLGNAFVAPVIAYVPEGKIGSDEMEHIQWPGTITVPDKVLEETLTWAAMSMKQHGFKHIYFIGDSYFNQEPQARVAERLRKIWADDGVTVLHLADYYAANGQTAFLADKGYSPGEIGMHAGMRDTSELIYVRSKAVRHGNDIVKPMEIGGFMGQDDKKWPTGYHGDPRKASWWLGKKMIQLKIDAALRQIERDTGRKVGGAGGYSTEAAQP